MYRYLAIVRQTDDAATRNAVDGMLSSIRGANRGLSCAHDGDCLTIFHTSCETGTNRSRRIGLDGILLGVLFRALPLGQAAPESLPACDIDFLRRNYWGRYIVFLRDKDGRYSVCRDPSGALPCYIMECDRSFIVFSHIDDLRLLLAPKLTINWHFIKSYLVFDRIVTSSTGFNEITQVLGGERVLLTARGITRSFYWNPIDIAETDVIDDAEDALAALAEVTRGCVRAWASQYDRIVHQLSGGLDSAIVLSCLSGAVHSRDIVCINLSTDAAETDERYFAKLAANNAHCELMEIRQSPYSKTLVQMLTAAGFASPQFATFESDAEDARRQLVTDRRAQAIFTGQGGDHLFQRRRDTLVASEYLHRNGVGAELPRLILDNARLSGRSVWSVLCACLRYAVARRSFDPYSAFGRSTLMTVDARQSVEDADIRHGWFPRHTAWPAAKFRHLFDIVDCQQFYAVRCTFADIVHPLISQPLMECSLRIPTYRLCDVTGGLEARQSGDGSRI
jgi:asparagine synthase (glutamine-hydrolysing)